MPMTLRERVKREIREWGWKKENVTYEDIEELLGDVDKTFEEFKRVRA
tara:strand:+ start:72 stop:215 length:144 start_codon:yes stop_codon:yes gene_type:complete